MEKKKTRPVVTYLPAVYFLVAEQWSQQSSSVKTFIVILSTVSVLFPNHDLQ